MSTIEFTSHFDQLQKKLLPFAYRLTNNLEDAKDLIQETAIRAYNNKEKFEVGTNFRAWVTTIMRNTFINFYRKKKNRATSCEPSDSYVFINEEFAEDNGAGSNIMMGELSQIIGKLDETYRKPFLMFFGDHGDIFIDNVPGKKIITSHCWSVCLSMYRLQYRVINRLFLDGL